MTGKTRPSIVFAHGLWADGSCFSKVIPALQLSHPDFVLDVIRTAANSV